MASFRFPAGLALCLVAALFALSHTPALGLYNLDILPKNNENWGIVSPSGYRLSMTDDAFEEAAARLTPEQRFVTLEKGTERPFHNAYYGNHKKGVYVGVLGGLPLFTSEAKYESGTGWPSFYEPVDPTHVIEVRDESHGMVRVEVMDARSGAHLGHVFNDGPEPTGKRYCINSAALKFVPEGAPLQEY